MMSLYAASDKEDGKQFNKNISGRPKVTNHTGWVQIICVCVRAGKVLYEGHLITTLIKCYCPLYGRINNCTSAAALGTTRTGTHEQRASSYSPQ